MKKVIHKADSRGKADHDWLKVNHTFSFADYYNPERVHFGALRVLNDDTIAAGKGFGTHPHDNMEIITIPLYGDLEHKDSMGNSGVISEGEIQAMSAGSGIQHSEYNKNSDKEVKVLQIWVFPNEKNVAPRYDQISIKNIETENKLFQILSPNKKDAGSWIHQEAWFQMGNLRKGKSIDYILNGENHGVYIFIIEGSLEVEESILEKRDGIGISETNNVKIKTLTDSKILIMEVPMNIN
ncbi:MAG: pirin family protein [Bacteroidales bacterium]|nr:pirin family protein [Bacteroidales bacterium]